MNKQDFFGSIRMFLVLTVMTGIHYPLVVTIAAKIAFRNQADGSIVYNKNGTAVGSTLIAQQFSDSTHFTARPSACSYATVASGASNLGVTSSVLHDSVIARAKVLGKPVGKVPADLIFASGSGLDPHISPEAALIQVDRIVKARALSGENRKALIKMIASRTEKPQWGLFGEARVNVLLLNCDIDSMRVNNFCGRRL